MEYKTLLNIKISAYKEALAKASEDLKKDDAIIESFDNSETFHFIARLDEKYGSGESFFSWKEILYNRRLTVKENIFTLQTLLTKAENELYLLS